MASFAPGTPQKAVNNYYQTAPRSLGGQVPDDRHAFGVPNTGGQPSAWYSQPGRAQPQQPAAPAAKGFAAYSPGAAQPQQSPYSTSTAYNPSAGRPFSALQAPWWTPGSPGGSSSPGPRLAKSQPSPPAQRTPITRPTQSRAPGVKSPMPAGTPQSLLPFYQQAQQMAPGADRFQQVELANKLNMAQQQQGMNMLRGAQDQANAAWRAEQNMLSQQQMLRDPPPPPRQMEQELEKRRQKARQQEALNNAQRMDPNWALNQERANATRMDQVRRKMQEDWARKQQAAEVERAQRGGGNRGAYYDAQIRQGLSPGEARKSTDEAYNWAPVDTEKQSLYWQQVGAGKAPWEARSYADSYFANAPR